MNIDTSILISPPDEIVRLLLDTARRADELVRRSDAREIPGRDFWQEAEREVWAGRPAE